MRKLSGMKWNYLIKIWAVVFIAAISLPLSAQSDSPFVVVLDAGHGGKDPGNLGNGYKEKDIALNIILEIGKKLEALPDFKVIYTRKTDDFVELLDRAKIANKAKADLFVSVHCNAHNSQASGTETFVLGVAQSAQNFEVAKRENSVIFLEDNYEVKYEGFDPNSPETVIGLTLVQEEYLDQSILLAAHIQENFEKKYQRGNRGVKQANLLVNRLTFMPSVLVEVGFLTNKSEGAYLHSPKGQAEMAQAVFDAVILYRQQLGEGNTLPVLTSQSEKPTPEESSPRQASEDVFFKIQLFASSRRLTLKPSNFKGLSEISTEKTGKLYRYFFDKTSDYSHAQRLLSTAKNKGYSDAFIVAYRREERISVDEALNLLKN